MKSKIKVLSAAIILFFCVNSAQAQMFWNNAAVLSGSNSYVAVKNSLSLNLTGSFTLEAWINPSSTSGLGKGIISKSTGLTIRYALRLVNGGRIVLMTNSAQRLITSLDNIVPANKWTHVAGTYNSATGRFSIFINGNLDTNTIIAGAAPATNSDSLYIGTSGSPTDFPGKIDDVRVWNTALSLSEISSYYRTTMAETSGKYNGLVLSMTFQDENADGTDANVRDMTGTGNNGNPRNVTFEDQSFTPYHTTYINEFVTMDGTGYLSAKDTSVFDATSEITFECWIRPSTIASYTIVSKGSTVSPSYFLGWNGAKLIARINGVTMNNNTINIPLSRWSHIAFTYKSTGSNAFYLNGVKQWGGFDAVGSITPNNDSLFIGGGPGALNEFNGSIDEVRITKNHAKTELSILRNLNNSIERTNRPPAGENVVYNFDGLLVDNADAGGTKLRFVNDASFGHPQGDFDLPALSRDEQGDLSEGFYLQKNGFKIVQDEPVSSDTLEIYQNESINDINLFFSVNHTSLNNLEIILKSPAGDSVTVFSNNSSVDDDININTVFDDQADSSLVSGRYVTFSPMIKPFSGINSKFTGERSNGKWILIAKNLVSTNKGTVTSWGIQINNNSTIKMNVDCFLYLQGFYNGNGLMRRDTVTLRMISTISPAFDESRAVVDSTGYGRFAISTSLFENSCLARFTHRNSIETWSDENTFFNNFTESIFLHDSPQRALGENLALVDDLLMLYGIYSGDVNQDDNVNLTDIVDIFNAASGFSTGYIQTDITGDNTANLTDLVLVFNNSANFVQAIVP